MVLRINTDSLLPKVAKRLVVPVVEDVPELDVSVLPSPQPGAQTTFYNCESDVVVYGGAAGSAKSFGLLLKAARHIESKGYGAVLFRRTSGEIRNEGGLVDESRKIYEVIPGAEYRETFMDWSFPWGSSISFGYADKIKERYTGSQIGFIGIDEVQFWTEAEVSLLLSRNRSTCGVKPQLCMTCNPDPDCYVAGLIEWWIDPATGYPRADRAGIERYFYRIDRTTYWGDSPEELEARFPDLSAIAPPKSLTFIPGSIYDNPALLKANPQYLASLLSLPKIEMERLLKGNWKITDSQRSLFDSDGITRNATGQWSNPQSGHYYLVAVDPNFGAIGGDYWVVQAWDITSLPIRLVAEYRDNSHTTVYHRQQTLELIDRYAPLVTVVEGNSGGKIVAENLAVDRPKLTIETITTGTLTKRVNTDRIALMVQQDEVIYPGDWAGIEEMRKFDRLNRVALSGHDDTVLCWAAAGAVLEEALSLRKPPSRAAMVGAPLKTVTYSRRSCFA